MNIKQLDKYILGLIEKNGWYMGRQFQETSAWLVEIEKNGYQSFDLARHIICELGGLSFREYAPLTYQRMIDLRRKEGREIPSDFANDIKAACEKCLDILRIFHMEDQAEKYSGATFTFDALLASRDDEIILDIKTIKDVVGGTIFPIGTVAPDGISFVDRKGRIYTVFNDSIYLSGENIESFLNMMFTKSMKPIILYQL